MDLDDLCRATKPALTREGNIGTIIDTIVLGKAHLYRWEGGFEPEGLLGTLPATVNVIAGYLAAYYLKKATRLSGLIMRFAILGLLIGIAALGMSTFIPISKKLWTPSFVGITIGLDLIIMALFVQVYDRLKWSYGIALFKPLGLNPLAIYLFSELFVVVLGLIPVNGHSLWTWFCVDLIQKLLPGALGALVAALAYFFICWLVAYILYRRRISLKI